MQAKFTTGIALVTLMAMLTFAPAWADPDWNAVGQILGKTGTELPGGVYKVTLPRSDLAVMLDGVAIKPTLALGSWLAFRAVGKDSTVMGDLVLTQDEVNPVVKRLAEGGIEISALHNHLLRAEPATMYLHVEGHGESAKLAETLRAALDLSKTPLGEVNAAGTPQPVDLDVAALDKVLGYPGKTNGGVYQFSIPRAETPMENGMALLASMGTGIAINFQPTGSGKAAVTGDFVLIASEVNPVQRVLRENGIEVTAIHNHMLDEQPRLFFMHFWANADAAKLAHGLRAALDKVNLAKS